MPWRVEILNETVKAELESLSPDIRAKLTRILDMMVVHRSAADA